MTKLNLDQFYGGTLHYYRHALNPKLVYTAGVKYVADTAGAYWLIDEIALSQITIPAEPFQVWKLTVYPDNTGLITVTGVKYVAPLHQKRIPFTDFPEPSITIWFTDNTILLPCEY